MICSPFILVIKQKIRQKLKIKEMCVCKISSNRRNKKRFGKTSSKYYETILFKGILFIYIIYFYTHIIEFVYHSFSS